MVISVKGKLTQDANLSNNMKHAAATLSLLPIEPNFSAVVVSILQIYNQYKATF